MLLLNSVPPDLWQAIIHTSYFAHDEVRDLIVSQILKRSGNEDQYLRFTSGRQHVQWLSSLRKDGAGVPSPQRFETKLLWSAVVISLAAAGALITSAASGIFVGYVQPVTYQFQIDKIVATLGKPASLAVRNTDIIGHVLADLVGLGKVTDPRSYLGSILDEESAAQTVQRLAYYFAGGNEQGLLEQVLKYEPSHDEGNSLWAAARAGAYLHAIAGTVDDHRQVPAELKRSAIEALNNSPLTSQLTALAMSVLSGSGMEAELDALMAKKTDISWCRHELENRKSGRNHWEKFFEEKCKKSVPPETHNVPPKAYDLENQPGGVQTFLASLIEVLTKIDRKEVPLDLIKKLLALKEATEPQNALRLWEVADKLNAMGANPATNEIVNFILSQILEQAKQADSGLMLIEQPAVKAVAMLTKFNKLDRIQQLLNGLENLSAPSADQVRSYLSDEDFEIQKSAVLATVALSAGNTAKAELAVRTADRVIRSSNAGTSPWELRHILNVADKALLVKSGLVRNILDLAVVSASKAVEVERRSVFYQEVARRFITFGDIFKARTIAELAPLPYTEAHDDLDGDDPLSGLSEGGFLAGYLSILDAEVQRQTIQKFGLSAEQRLEMPQAIGAPCC